MRITKTTSYAFRILLHCARLGERHARISDIARANQITVHNVFKIVPALVEAGLLESARGRGGGVRLAKPPSEIRIGEIVRVMEPTRIEADCFGGAEVECAIRPSAPINRLLDDAFSAFVEVLDQHTLQDWLDLRPRVGTGAPGDPLTVVGEVERVR